MERRRLRGDLVEVYKVFMGFTGVDVGVFFYLAVMEGLRGHSRKLGKRGCRLDFRKNFSAIEW